MFRVPKINMIASDEGFTVHILGRTGIEYSEGTRTMFVDSEVLASGHGISIFKSSVRGWRAPHDGEVLTEEKRAEIIENISKAIRFRGQPVEVL
jgi:Immunity protein 74